VARFSLAITCSHNSTLDFPSSRTGDRRLDPLFSPGKLHFLPLLSSSLIQGRLPSVFIPQAAQSTCVLS
jgi:hypothetical protein